MRIWLVILLIAPLLGRAEPVAEAEQAEPVAEAEQKDEIEGWEAAAPAPADPNEPPLNWVDTSHAYATNQAQVLTQWMDNFFGDPNYDIEKAESLLRLEWVNDWDEDDDYNTKVRLRGKLQLPRISKRLNLVFSGSDGDDLTEDELKDEDRVGLLYNVTEQNRSRFDLTLGVSTDELRPGVRYRNQGPINDLYSYRFTQRVQYETDEGFYTTGQLNLDQALGEDKLLRWSNRAIYGEESDGVEWRTKLSLRHRLRALHKNNQRVISYFASVNGATDPSYTRNYRLGLLFRRQLYRQFLFVELEPSYNFRRRDKEDDREGAWNVVLRFEIALERNLARFGRTNDEE